MSESSPVAVQPAAPANDESAAAAAPAIPATAPEVAAAAPVAAAAVPAVAPESTAAAPAAAAAVERPPPPPISDVKKRMMRQMVTDSLVALANQLHHYVRHDPVFREHVLRYLHKVKLAYDAKKEPEIQLFAQSFKNHHWSPIETHAVQGQAVQTIFPEAGKLAQQLAAVQNDTILLLLDYTHTAAPYMTVRLTTVLCLWRSEQSLAKREKGMSLQDYMEVQVKWTRLIDDRMLYAAFNNNEYSLEARDLLMQYVAEELKIRDDLADAYASEQVDSDVRRACLVWNVHDAVAVQDGAAPDGLAPMPYFKINCGSGDGDARIEQLTAAKLTELIQRAKDANIHTEMIDHYEQALLFMRKKREPGDAIVTVCRGADGVNSTMCSIRTNVYNIRAMGAFAEEERRAIRLHQEKLKAEFDARVAKVTAVKK
jgi:hypothetical protein